MSEMNDKFYVFKLIAESKATSRDEIGKDLRKKTEIPLCASRAFKKVYTEFRELVLSGDMPQNIIDILIKNGKLEQYKKQCVNQNSGKKSKSKLKTKSETKIENKGDNKGEEEGAKKGGKLLTIDNIVKDLQKHKHINELVEIYNVIPEGIITFIDQLKMEGYNISQIGDNYKLSRDIIPVNNVHESQDWKDNLVIKFGVVSDTHLCSKHQQITFLNSLYDLFEQEGINTVYHAGDLTEGYNKRRSEHIYDLFKIGADEQSDYVIEKYPYKPSIKTKFITGNHDAWHTSNGGVDIGKRIARERKDMEYLGCLNATVYLTPNCKMELNHPLDGASYALSYSIQKYIDSMSGGDKPNILLNGHHHKFGYLFYRNIHALECGTTEAQSAWMKGKRIAAHIGGCIITVHIDKNGTIKRFMPEFIPLYKVLKNDY